MTNSEAKATIETHGRFIKDCYGVSKEFHWKQYAYNNDRYNVSQFSDEVEHIARIYCEVCGRAFLPSATVICYGLHTCNSCNAQAKG